jgi:multiple sugar transport system substrate-binding protein
MLAAFGSPLMQPDGTVDLDPEAGLKMAEFLIELLEVSPPDILSMAWDQRIERFSRGHVAFTYGWTARTPMAEEDPLSVVRGLVGFALPPMYNKSPARVPFGQWSLGIPSNLSPAERARAMQLWGYLMSPNGMKQWSHPGYSRLIVSPLSESKESLPVETHYSGVTSALLAVQRHELLDPDIRPAIPQWPELADVLGTVFHDMLRGEMTPEAAVSGARAKIRTLFNPLGEDP